MAGPTIAISTQTDSMSSVEIEDRAKGAPKCTVKIYAPVGQEEEALAKAIDIHKRLTEHYAWMNGTSKLPPAVKVSQPGHRHDPALVDPSEKGDSPFN